jgi:PAS domain S-box-containing protein
MTPPLQSRRKSIRIVFALIIAAVIIPGLLVGGWFAQGWAKSERSRTERDLIQKTREIASNVDREITAATTMLTALASSPWLRARDFAAFHGQAAEVARKLNTQIVLFNPQTERQIFNTAVPWGAALPQNDDPEVIQTSREALRTGNAAVSNVFVGPLIKRPVLSLGVPATDNLGAAYYLAVGLPADQFAAVLQRTTIGPDRIAAIVDRNGIIISRSQQHAESTGTHIAGDPAPPGLKEGVVKSKNRDGIPFYWFFHRTALTGWAVGVGIPAAVLEAPLQLATVHYGFASGLFFIVAVGLAYGFGARLPRSFGTLGIDRQPTRAEFRVLFDSAPNGVSLVDQEGIILLANRWMAQRFGYSSDELIGKPVEMLVPERFRAGHAMRRRNFALAPAPRVLGGDRNLYGQRKDGSEFPIEISLDPIDADGGNLTLATVTDISMRKQLSDAEIALRASEEQRRLAIEAAELGPWSWDLVKDEMWWSDHMRKIIGVPASMPASHATWFDRLHPADRHLVEEIFSRRLSGARYHDYEYRIRRLDDGATRDLSSKGQTTFDESGKPVSVLGVVQDITARKAAERARDDLRRSLMHAQEKERLRLARELHDEAGQSLAAVQMQLKRMESAASDAERSTLRALHLQLEQMGAALHRISCELRPASIDELGLATVLANYVSEWSSHFSVSADFHCRDTNLDGLADDIRTTIFRVTQESLTNIGKHARGASCASVVIDRVGDEVRLTIEDNGCGFEAAADGPSGTSPQERLGLAGMRERLTLIGGSLEVESSSKGSTIFARIPANPARQDRINSELGKAAGKQSTFR